MVRPVFVVVFPMRLTTVTRSRSGRPRQFLEMKLNMRCSILFHLLVHGGKCETWRVRLRSLASRWSSVFHSRTRLPLLPPPSAVIYSSVAFLYKGFPICCHQARIVATANSAV